MTKLIKAKDSNNLSFVHTFSDEDWKKISGLKTKASGKVEFSEGVATVEGDNIFITMKSPGGKRVYDFSKAVLFK